MLVTRGKHRPGLVAALAAVMVGLAAPALVGAGPDDGSLRDVVSGRDSPGTTMPAEPESPCPPPPDDPDTSASSTTTTTSTTSTTTTAPPGQETTTISLPEECLPLCDDVLPADELADELADAADPVVAMAAETAGAEGAPDGGAAPTGAEPTSAEPTGAEPTGTEPMCRPAESLDPPADDPVASVAPPDEPLEPPVAETAPGPAPDAGVEPEVAPEPDLPSAALPPEPEGGWPVRPIAFPVLGPVSFDDDWGACRGGPDCPRRHIGNDVIGGRLQPLVAAASGVVTHLVDHPTAGYGLVVTDADGWDYRYYHVNNDTPGTDDAADDGTWRFVAGLGVGTEVVAGQVIAFMGDSGNSESSVPHLHFEIHQPDGSPINPNRSLLAAEWAARCSGASDPYRDAVVPVPQPAAATTAAPLTVGAGHFLLGPDGSWAPFGDARHSGDARHDPGPPCAAVADPHPAG